MAPSSTFEKNDRVDEPAETSDENAPSYQQVRNRLTTPYKDKESSQLPLTSCHDYIQYMRTHPNAKVIGIGGKLYDVTNFIKVHPGGDIIERFIGKDSTSAFNGFHEKDVLKYRFPVGTYEMKPVDFTSTALAKLHKSLREDGFFVTDKVWFAKKIAVTFTFLLVTILLVTSPLMTSRLCLTIAAISLAGFWQQSGFLMHDFMHNHVFQNRRLDQWFGTFFGTVCFGVNGSWWRDEHFVHHAYPNTVNYEKGVADPQMHEDVWAQNEKLFPFHKSLLHRLAIRIQHISFIPLCVGVGRIGIIVDSFSKERGLREWVAVSLHWVWVLTLLSQFPTKTDAAIFYAIAAIIQGILHIQLLISHYSKTGYEEHQIGDTVEWYRVQIESNINITNPVWLDWFHGGLNFHIEHHLFPTMPRHNYRAAGARIKQLCKEMELEYDECTWSEAVVRTIRNLKQMSTLFSMDPR